MANKYRLNLPGLENVTLTKNQIKDIIRAGARFGIYNAVKNAPKEARSNIIKAAPHIAKQAVRNYAGLNILSPVKEKKNSSRINMPTPEMEAQWDAENKAAKQWMIQQISTKPTQKNKKYYTKPVKKPKNHKGRISNTVKKYIDEAVQAGLEAGQQLIQAPIDELPIQNDNYIPAQVMPSAQDVARAQALPELPQLYPVQTGDVFNGYQSEPDVYARGGYLMYNPFYIG